MEQIKDIIKNKYELLIMTTCVLFVIGVLFFTANDGGIGIFATAGKSLRPLLGKQAMINEGTGHLQDIGSGYVPIVKYEGGAQKAGSCVELKKLLFVRLEDGTYINGREEDG